MNAWEVDRFEAMQIARVRRTVPYDLIPRAEASARDKNLDNPANSETRTGRELMAIDRWMRAVANSQVMQDGSLVSVEPMIAFEHQTYYPKRGECPKGDDRCVEIKRRGKLPDIGEYKTPSARSASGTGASAPPVPATTLS